MLKSFGLVIRKLRESRGMSQEELANTSGLHRTYISDVERGKRNISLLNIQAIAIALNMPIHQVFAEVEKQTSKNK